MNYLNQKNMDKYVEYWQEIGNLPDVELVGTNDFDCLPLLIMSYYNDYQFFLVNWMKNALINWALHFSYTN